MDSHCWIIAGVVGSKMIFNALKMASYDALFAVESCLNAVAAFPVKNKGRRSLRASVLHFLAVQWASKSSSHFENRVVPSNKGIGGRPSDSIVVLDKSQFHSEENGMGRLYATVHKMV